MSEREIHGIAAKFQIGQSYFARSTWDGVLACFGTQPGMNHGSLWG